MKAIVQEGYGPVDGVLHLRDVPRPAVGDHEVLVRVCAASVHPDVWHVVTGRPFNGAGGGVGSMAVQLARAYGARVTGVDGPDKLDMVRSLGANHVVDYTREDFTRGAERYDLIFDVASSLSLSDCRRALTPTGTMQWPP